MDDNNENLKAMYQQWKLGLLNDYERKEMINLACRILTEKAYNNNFGWGF